MAAIINSNYNSYFCFNEVGVKVYEEIKIINPRKSAKITDIPIRVLKENADIFADYISGFFNESIKTNTCPSVYKNANITPVFKKSIHRF